MTRPEDLRASKRIPVQTKVQVRTAGRMAAYALALNISMGGIFLAAAPTMPVGSTCKLEISLPNQDMGKSVLVEGKVVRTDGQGTAIQFTAPLDNKVYQEFINIAENASEQSMVGSYLTYLKVGQSSDPTESQKLMGISRSTYNKVFLSTFCTSIPLAILPVLLLQGSIPPSPAWVKVVASFGYGLVWMGIIQPAVDLTVFKIIRNQRSKV